MKDIEVQAVLEEMEIVPVMQVARDRGPLAFALTAWCYEFGARISEPGMQLWKDVDLRLGRARPAHLKQGQKPVWHPLLPFCREALPAWQAMAVNLTLRPEAARHLFPSKIRTGRCYVCKGIGERERLKRDGKRRYHDGTKTPCNLCDGTGVRWGMAAPEAYKIVHGVLVAAGIPNGRNHPHVLRHSIITHLLNAGTAAKVIQDRVGHRSLETTLAYARTTEQALAELEGRLASRGIYDTWRK